MPLVAIIGDSGGPHRHMAHNPSVSLHKRAQFTNEATNLEEKDGHQDMILDIVEDIITKCMENSPDNPKAGFGSNSGCNNIGGARPKIRPTQPGLNNYKGLKNKVNSATPPKHSKVTSSKNKNSVRNIIDFFKREESITAHIPTVVGNKVNQAESRNPPILPSLVTRISDKKSLNLSSVIPKPKTNNQPDPEPNSDHQPPPPPTQIQPPNLSQQDQPPPPPPTTLSSVMPNKPLKPDLSHRHTPHQPPPPPKVPPPPTNEETNHRSNHPPPQPQPSKLNLTNPEATLKRRVSSSILERFNLLVSHPHLPSPPPPPQPSKISQQTTHTPPPKKRNQPKPTTPHAPPNLKTIKKIKKLELEKENKRKAVLESKLGQNLKTWLQKSKARSDVTGANDIRAEDHHGPGDDREQHEGGDYHEGNSC